MLLGDAKNVLKAIPTATIDCVMTSPPYWGKREYASGGIGQEATVAEYVKTLNTVFRQVKRVLKPTGSFWLNIGDTYDSSCLSGIPWRVALCLTDREGWVMKNSVIWNKMKSGMDNSGNRLGNIHENVFHFVKQPRGYYYDVDAIRSEPQSARIENGSVVSSTGVTGVKYRAQIGGSVVLSEAEKASALAALDDTIAQMAKGHLSDFRMIIRGNQRTTHSDSDKVSGRAKELRDKGYYIIRCHPRGSKPADVWNIVPEDTHNRKLHFAPYPMELCRIPILATCPQAGVVLDPFCGTGTTLLVAHGLGRKSVGVDCSMPYLELAHSRCHERCH
jgi:site-specific DNA-methyltransferase (adenine-specific)